MIKRKFENCCSQAKCTKTMNRAFFCDKQGILPAPAASLLTCWFISIYYLSIYLFIYLLFSKANAVYCDNFCIFPSSLTFLACGSDSDLSLLGQATHKSQDKLGSGLNNAIWKWQCDKNNQNLKFSQFSKAPWLNCPGSEPAPACPAGELLQ